MGIKFGCFWEGAYVSKWLSKSSEDGAQKLKR